MKKKILIAYPEMLIGGSTTSLLNLLNTIDYRNYEVDLLMYKKRGDHLKDIPHEVNILSQASIDNHYFSKIFKTFKNGYLLRALISQAKYKKKLGLNIQVMGYAQASISRKVEGDYDVAIGFLELWANAIVIDESKVKAKKRINWIHTDYKNCSYIPEIDMQFFNKSDLIVCVSDKCLTNFKSSFPELSGKSAFLENILSEKYILSKADEEVSFLDSETPGLKVITVCRISMLTKGLDRAVDSMKKLKSEGYVFKWYIVGDGDDLEELKARINEAGLQQDMILLGKKNNPYPYYKKCDLFVLPSRYEGKPMSVTEAQMLGLPTVVTRYSSAEEQIVNDFNGIIVENNDHSLYNGLKKILDNPALLELFKINLQQKDISNEYIIEDFYRMLE